jgi:hypothetical protein
MNEPMKVWKISKINIRKKNLEEMTRMMVFASPVSENT